MIEIRFVFQILPPGVHQSESRYFEMKRQMSFIPPEDCMLEFRVPESAGPPANDKEPPIGFSFGFRPEERTRSPSYIDRADVEDNYLRIFLNMSGRDWCVDWCENQDDDNWDEDTNEFWYVGLISLCRRMGCEEVSEGYLIG
jgi:hypothetical protein